MALRTALVYCWLRCTTVFRRCSASAPVTLDIASPDSSPAQAAHHLIQEFQAVRQPLRGGRRIAHAGTQAVQILLDALHRQFEALEVTAHALELLTAHGAAKIAEFGQQLRAPGRALPGWRPGWCPRDCARRRDRGHVAVELASMTAASPRRRRPERAASAARRALLFSASKALVSPRSAFCASNGIRCTTKDNCSGGAAVTGALPRVSKVSAAGAEQAQHEQRRPARGRIVALRFWVGSACSTRRLQKALAFHQGFQTQHRPHLAAAAKGARKIAIAANHGRRRLGIELRLRRSAGIPAPHRPSDPPERPDG